MITEEGIIAYLCRAAIRWEAHGYPTEPQVHDEHRRMEHTLAMVDTYASLSGDKLNDQDYQILRAFLVTQLMRYQASIAVLN